MWYAYHCLPRDPDGSLPSLRQLEREHQLSNGILSRVLKGERLAGIEHETIKRIRRALRVTEHWLDYGGPDGPPPPPYPIPPRPGTTLLRYRDLADWEAVQDEGAALGEKLKLGLPDEAFEAAGDMAVTRPVARLTPSLALATAWHAWETLPEDDRARYSTGDARGDRRKQSNPTALRRAAK